MSTNADDNKYSLLNMKNSEFLETQLTSPDLSKIQEQFNLDSEDKASSILKFYQDTYFTLQTYSDRFTTDYLKANWTQTGLLRAYEATEIFTLNNITSIRLQQKVDDRSLSCKEIFDVNPYLEMCTHLELNIEYQDVLKMFVSAYFDLDSEKEVREYIRRIMGQNEAFLKGLFDADSKVKFNSLVREVLADISKDFTCQDSCRQILAEKQFLFQNLFESQKAGSLYELQGNDEILKYIPEVGSYIQKLLEQRRSEEGDDSEDLVTCSFLSHNVLNFNANSIFNVNQLSLFFTYAELNNKYNLLNFLKVRCDPEILLKTLEYFFISWGLPNFYVDIPIQLLYEKMPSTFLENVKKQKEIDGGFPDIDPDIDFKVLNSEFGIEAFTGKDNLSDMRKLVSIDHDSVEQEDMTLMFQSLLDYRNLKGIELLTRSMKLKSSETSRP